MKKKIAAPALFCDPVLDQHLLAFGYKKREIPDESTLVFEKSYGTMLDRVFVCLTDGDIKCDCVNTWDNFGVPGSTWIPANVLRLCLAYGYLAAKSESR